MDPSNQTRAGKRAGKRAGTEAGTRDDVGELVDELERTGAFSAGTEADAAGASSSSDRPLGDVAAGVAVDVDREALLAEAAAIAASSSDAPTPASSSELAPAIAVDVEAKAREVAPALRLLVAQCAGTFAPNWEISKAEGDGVADAAALVMAYWMPDGVLEPKYLAIITLATSLYGVAGARRLPDGSWVPLRAPRSSSSTTPPATPPAGSPAPGPAGTGLKLV